MEEKKRSEEEKINLKDEIKKKVHRHKKHHHIEHKEEQKPIVHRHKKHHHIEHKEKPIKHHRHKHHAQIKKIKVIQGLPLEKKKLMTEKEIATDFAVKVQKKFDRMVKSSILFGSQVKNTASTNSDIDIILIIDDASLSWDMELIAWYREELGKLIAAQNYSKDLHINTIKLTTWWQDMIHGDPVVINVLRYGEALVDSGGFFNPLKALLLQGKMRSTPEAVYNALQRSPSHLLRSKLSILSSIEGVYWSMIDAAQAALITAGKLPPSPEHIPQMMKETFVDSGLLKIDKIRQLREIYLLHKGITHREIHDVKGGEIDRWQDIAESFLLEMTRIIDRLLESTKEEKK